MILKEIIGKGSFHSWAFMKAIEINSMNLGSVV